ncbi:MAG: alpha/beta fold hydrolase [Syntrophobacterales bacterium]|jgi:triacylglycerol esterase/lipase EstA (alpha/beta hydrolase family)
MFWLVLLLLFWSMAVAFTYVLFYYEAANGSHLEVLRTRGSVPVMILKGFLWSLYSHLLVLLTAATALHREYYSLPAGAAKRTPIIFVHGLYHNHTAWYLYLRWFRRWGWSHMKAIKLKGKFRSIHEFARILADEVEQVIAETQSEKVDLVGQSMGGLVIRSYLAENSGRAKIRRVVTLGSPHRGSKLAVFGRGQAAREMVPGSAFLESLNHGVQFPENGRFYAIYTIVDNMVLPNESTKLTWDGVKNMETRIVNHVGLAYCKHTARLVRDCLSEE